VEYNPSFNSAIAAFMVVGTFAFAGFSIAAAATKEEVAHCRAIGRLSDRLDCFESLKQSPKSKNEQFPITRDLAQVANDTVRTPPDDSHRFARSGDRAITGSINRLSFFPGQPFCRDREALGALMLAGLLTSDLAKATTIGCQSIPEDAKLEVLERYPGIFSFVRIVRVKVTSHTKPDLESGFTIELGPEDSSSPR
jgi:hypothetical protein